MPLRSYALLLLLLCITLPRSMESECQFYQVDIYPKEVMQGGFFTISLNVTARALPHKIAKLNITIDLPEGMQLIQGRTFFLDVEEIKEKYLVNVSMDILPGTYKIPLMADGIIEVGEGLYRTISFTEELKIRVHRFKIVAKMSAAPVEAEPSSPVALMALISNRLSYPGRYMTLSNITIRVISSSLEVNETLALPQLLPLEDRKLTIPIMIPDDAKSGPNVVTMITCYKVAGRLLCQTDSTSVIVVRPANVHFKISAPDSAANESVVTVNITLLNTGKYPAIDVAVELVNLELGEVIARESLGELPPGEESNIALRGVIRGPDTTRLVVKLTYMSEGAVKPTVKEQVVRVSIAPGRLAAKWLLASMASVAALATILYAAYRVKGRRA